LFVGFEVPESGDDLEVLVDDLAVSAALAQDLPLFEPGEDVFDAGMDPSVYPVEVIVTDDLVSGAAAGAGDGGDAAVSAVAQDCSSTSVEEVPASAEVGSRAVHGQDEPLG
jgi:hypothetical protein